MPDAFVNDVINHLAGIGESSPAAALRARKPDLVKFAQGSYDALLEPAEPAGLSLVERHAIACRVGLLTNFDAVAVWHRGRLAELGASADTIAGVTSFPEETMLSDRLRALLRHTDLVTTSPGSAEPEDIQALKAAGLTPTAIVTVGQLIGFLGYEVRAIAVARAFAEEQS